MVLNHVAQRAGLVIEAGATLDAELFGDRDLHVLHAASPPQRLEQRITETQRQQVLHCFLTEIVVDTEDLLLGEDATDAFVDLRRRRLVMAERLFQHDARIRRRQLIGRETFANRRKQVRRDRQEERTPVIFATFELFLQAGEVLGVDEASTFR